MIATLAGVLLISFAPAQDKEEPKVAPLQLVSVKLSEKGTFDYEVLRYVEQVVLKTVETKIDGKIVVKTVKEIVKVPVVETRRETLANVTVYDSEGKRVNDDVAEKILREGAKVVIAADSVLPNAAARETLKKGTLILVIKKSVPKVEEPKKP